MKQLTRGEIVRASAPEDEGGIDLPGRLRRWVADIEAVYAAAMARGKFADAIQALRTATHIAELYAEVTGELDARPQTNIAVVPLLRDSGSGAASGAPDRVS